MTEAASSGAKYTEGPWKVVMSDNATPHIMTRDAYEIDEREALVCVMPAEITRNYNSLANARLIAAAPEMFGVLGDVPNPWTASQDDWHAWNKRRIAAINLAKEGR